jgi:hypothetical protein
MFFQQQIQKMFLIGSNLSLDIWFGILAFIGQSVVLQSKGSVGISHIDRMNGQSSEDQS